MNHNLTKLVAQILSERKDMSISESEQIDEIGDTKKGRMVLSQYRVNARKDMFSHRDMADDAFIAKQQAHSDKHDDKADKRMHGLMAAKNRLSKKTPWLNKRLGLEGTEQLDE